MDFNNRQSEPGWIAIFYLDKSRNVLINFGLKQSEWVNLSDQKLILLS